ncbi:hypothetical protein [Dyella terrae]|nr:hypothetical protein [Dyella terrae]
MKIVTLLNAQTQPWHGYYYLPHMTLSHPVNGDALPQHMRLDTPSPARG